MLETGNMCMISVNISEKSPEGHASLYLKVGFNEKYLI